jgi:hypothetical protein
MTDERLAQLELAASYPPPFDDFATQIVYDALRELVAEVKRLRALEQPAGFLESPIEATPEQVAEWQAAWDEMLATGVAMYDLTPQPRDPGWWTPLRNRIPRSNDRPAGG